MLEPSSLHDRLTSEAAACLLLVGRTDTQLPFPQKRTRCDETPGLCVSVLNETVTRLSGQRSRHTKTVDIQRKGAARSIESITELNAIARFVMHAFSCMRPHSIHPRLGGRTACDRPARPPIARVGADLRVRPSQRETDHCGQPRMLLRSLSSPESCAERQCSEEAAGRPVSSCLLSRQGWVQLFETAEISGKARVLLSCTRRVAR
jgi:hypothetical protein